MYPGVACYNHRRGELIEALGSLPPMDILAVDLGGCVDTLQFNRYPKNYSTEELDQIGRAYELVKTGLREQNLEKIGLGATMSARVNQRLLPKPHLEALIDISTNFGAHGICVAHSGTIAGLLFERKRNESLENARDEIRGLIDPTLNIFALQSL
jgi:L-threonine kinase